MCSLGTAFDPSLGLSEAYDIKGSIVGRLANDSDRVKKDVGTILLLLLLLLLLLCLLLLLLLFVPKQRQQLDEETLLSLLSLSLVFSCRLVRRRTSPSNARE